MKRHQAKQYQAKQYQDWDSLFFTQSPHSDQTGHDARMLRDMGLTRTESGELALAEDPTHVIAPPPRPGFLTHWLRALLSRITQGHHIAPQPRLVPCQQSRDRL